MKKQKLISWTLELCMESARQHGFISDWLKADKNAYGAAYRRKDEGWFEQCTAHMDQKIISWTLELCMESAQQHGFISDWKKSDRKAYEAAHNNGWFEQCTAHMEQKYISWTLELCMESAQQHKFVSVWLKADWNAYKAAYLRTDEGWFEQCTAHMVRLIAECDCVYIWEVVGEWFEGRQVYKVGVTSWRRGNERIKEVAKRSGKRVGRIWKFRTGELSALKVERLLLKMGRDPKYIEHDGATEFRAFNPEELAAAREIMEAHSEGNYSPMEPRIREVVGAWIGPVEATYQLELAF